MFFREPVLSALRSSQSRDLHRLICRLLTSLSLFRFFPLSAFLLPSTRLSLSLSLPFPLFLFLFRSFISLSFAVGLPSVFLSFSYFKPRLPKQFPFRLPRASPRSHPCLAPSAQSSPAPFPPSQPRLSLFCRVWQPFVPHHSSSSASSPWKDPRRSLQRIFGQKLSAI